VSTCSICGVVFVVAVVFPSTECFFRGGRETGAHADCIYSAGKMEEFFRYVAVPNGPKTDAEVFARYEMQYVGPPLMT
jgi:hypothetical protein